MSDSDTIWVHSHVAASDGHPYVVLNWGKESCQMTTSEAIAWAMGIIECAHAAEADASVAAALGGIGGDQDGVIAHLFAAMRGARDAGKFNSAKRSTRAERRREGKNG